MPAQRSKQDGVPTAEREFDLKFFLQDPTDSGTTYLIEALLEACSSAKGGGGGFAFASKGGTSLLLEDPTFAIFLKAGEFDLVVGIDAITNTKVLVHLAEVQGTFPKLKVRAFIHKKPGSLFHPKFCWFTHSIGGIVIAGSGNLTRGGLRGNWEAFTVNKLGKQEIEAVQKYWNAWIAANSDNLKPIDDPEVVERAKKNQAATIVLKKVLADAGVKAAEVAEDLDEDVGPQPEASSEVLIAEIPRSDIRWKQANFDLATFTGYFGATPGSHHSVLFYHVGVDGTLPEKPENRPAVTVKSRNFRFELEAASHLPYPAKGRPIGVFVRVAIRTFWYELLMPGDVAHAKVAAFLDKNYPPKVGKVRRVCIPFSEFAKILPKSPLVTLAQDN